MISPKKVLTTTVGLKYVMALSGLFLILFMLLHLLGNLQLLIPGVTGVEMFNSYAANFKKLGPLFFILEWGLFTLFLVHALVGWLLWLKSQKARNSRYAVVESKGGDSRWNISSRHMMLLGGVLLGFVVIHVLHFRFHVFGAPEKMILHGVEVENLHLLVVSAFQNPFWVVLYTGVMLFLGFHVRHGFWSMFQSIGAMPTPYSNVLYVVGTVLAALLALGFVILPTYLFIIY